jgi:hypothetical protein
MGSYPNRYSGEADFRFPALKCRTESFRKFKYASRGRKLELEGVFIYKSASPPRKPEFYKGYLDLEEEYRLLNLRPPEKNQLRIWCHIPSDLTSRDKLISKPNVRATGRVAMDSDKESTKRFLVDELEFLPIMYKAVGAPAFTDLDDMFSCIYSRGPELYEHGPYLLLASLIGSERRSRYFPEENVGCGINMGSASRDSPRAGSSPRGGKADIITSSMRKQLVDFIKKVNVGSLNKVSTQFKWNRFLSIEDPAILSRTMETDNEVDWNLISDIDNINQLRNSRFMTSDINLVFDPSLFPRRLSRDDIKNLKQTLLFMKSTPPMEYSKNIDELIEAKTDNVVRDLAKRVDYAPFLFRYRFEPLCDAFLKANHLEDYLLGGGIKIKEKDVRDFFKRAEDASCDFADYAEPYITDSRFTSIPDIIGDRRIQDLYREMLVKGAMTEKDMIHYLTERYSVVERKADSLVSSLLHAEPVLVVRKATFYKPIY